MHVPKNIAQFFMYLMKRVHLFCGSIDITPDGMKAIVTLSSGDMRRSLNILQVQPKAHHDFCALLSSVFFHVVFKNCRQTVTLHLL